jgi:hypothetical protein
MTQATLGFGMTLRPKRVFLGKESGCLWYFWDGEKQQPIVINESSLTGYLRGIERIELTSDYGVSEKLVITIDADSTYQIQIGFATWFSKTFLLSVNALDDLQLRSLLTIEPSSNSNSKVIFCNLFDWKANKIYPKHEWQRDKTGNLIDDIDWDSMVDRLKARLPLSSSQDNPEGALQARDIMHFEDNFDPEKDRSLAERVGVEPEALVF